jgi:dienelactone hydrolase
MKPFITLVLLSFFVSTALAEVKGEAVEYRAGDKTLKGFVAYDDAIKEKRPGILVVHEWWGHNDYARNRAMQLAEMGYTALAVDMYGDGKQADHPKDAGAFAGEVRSNMDQAEARFNAGVDLLKGHATVNSDQISAIGYCFGGGIVLEMARRGVDLDVVASFHGSLNTAQPAAPQSLVGKKILVFNGAADRMVKPEHVDAFKAEMAVSGADMTFVDYPDTLHAFTNPDADEYGQRFNIPLAYNPEADKDSWQGLSDGLKQAYGR